MTSFEPKKKKKHVKKMLFELQHLYLIGLLLTNHIIAYYNGILEFLRKLFMLKVT